MIKFENIEQTVLKNFNGGQGEFIAKMFVDDKNKILKGRLKKGCSIGSHTHETSSEIIFVLEGKGVVTHEGTSREITAGDCHYCKKGQTHSLENNCDEDLVFYAVVPQQ